MAEAYVEEQLTTTRFFCHKCSVEFENASPEYTCPHCFGGFIEELDANNDASEEVIDLDEVEQGDFEPHNNWEVPLPALSLPEMDRRSQRPRLHDYSRRRRYASVQPTYRIPRIGRPRATINRVPTGTGLRNATPFEHLIQDIVVNLGVGWSGNNTVPGNMLFLGNPGDYAWGREGLDSIVTQLLNQMDGTGPPPLPKEQIAVIPTVAVTQDQVDKKLQCSVCWEDYELNEKVKKLSCTHIFHKDCIHPWLELHGTCPICRQNLSPADEVPTNDSDNGNDSNELGLFGSLREFFQASYDIPGSSGYGQQSSSGSGNGSGNGSTSNSGGSSSGSIGSSGTTTGSVRASTSSASSSTTSDSSSGSATSIIQQFFNEVD